MYTIYLYTYCMAIRREKRRGSALEKGKMNEVNESIIES